MSNKNMVISTLQIKKVILIKFIESTLKENATSKKYYVDKMYSNILKLIFLSKLLM
jgi:hypothetical protein